MKNGEGLYFVNLYFSWQSGWILTVGLPLSNHLYNLVDPTTAGVVFVEEKEGSYCIFT